MSKKVLSVMVVLLWMLVIFLFSARNGTSSGGMSRKVITTTVEVFTEIEDETPEMEKIVDILSFPVRKSAHFFLYFVLGLLVMNALYTLGIEKRTILFAFLICACYALSDEWHQTFIDERSGDIRDVLLDSTASLCAIYFYHIIHVKRRKHE